MPRQEVHLAAIGITEVKEGLQKRFVVGHRTTGTADQHGRPEYFANYLIRVKVSLKELVIGSTPVVIVIRFIPHIEHDVLAPHVLSGLPDDGFITRPILIWRYPSTPVSGRIAIKVAQDELKRRAGSRKRQVEP